MGRLIVVMALILATGCSLDDKSDGIEIFSVAYDFQDGTDGWQADYTEYPVNESIDTDSAYQWTAEHTASPSAATGSAFKLSCNNLSGDVFMFIKTKLDGLKPNTNYNVVYQIDLCSNAYAGQGIILKAGASDLEPKKVIENGYYVLNVDKGLNTTSGENAISFGDIGTSTDTEYAAVTKGNSSAYEPFIARTNSKGELWLILGADSLYQGTTTIYFTGVEIFFSVSE